MSLERLASWALAAAFVAVVGLAAADAVRSDEESPPPSATTRGEADPRLLERLRTAHVGGRLIATVPNGCRRVVWRLPELEPAARDARGCPRVEPGPPWRWAEVACVNGHVELFDRASGELLRSLPGCAPAWQPGGGLTVAEERGIVLVRRDCAGPATRCRPRLIYRAALERAALQYLGGPLPPPDLRLAVRGVTWLGDWDAAVLLDLRLAGRLDQVLAFFAKGRFRGHQAVHGDRPRASPEGSYVALLPGVIVRTTDIAEISQVSLPPFLRSSRALAWSPDGRWLALAQRSSVVLVSVASLERYDATGSGLRTIDLPIEAAELEWR